MTTVESMECCCCCQRRTDLETPRNVRIIVRDDFDINFSVILLLCHQNVSRDWTTRIRERSAMTFYQRCRHDSHHSIIDTATLTRTVTLTLIELSAIIVELTDYFKTLWPSRGRTNASVQSLWAGPAKHTCSDDSIYHSK